MFSSKNMMEKAIFISGEHQFDALEIDGEVFVTGYDGPLGEIIQVKITHSYDYDLSGEVV